MSAPDTAASGWFSPFFWLACCFLVAAVLLGIVVLAALFRAPRSQATTVLSMFLVAFRSLSGGLRRCEHGDGDDDGRQAGSR